VVADAGLAETAARVTVTLDDGRALSAGHDLTDPQPAAVRRAKLRAKAAALVGAPTADRLWQVIAELERVPVGDLTAVLAAAGAAAA